MTTRVVTRQFLVYCAGPITSLSYEDAIAWYKEVEKKFPSHIIPVFPLRGKTWLQGAISVEDNYLTKHPLSTLEGIMTRDRFDVMRADALLVNLLGAQKVSIGTVIEIAWAHMLQKPVVVIMEKDNMHQHSMVRGCASLVVDTLDVGIDCVIRIVSPVYPA
jgi:nucleoside 2-deoxyribosyltransferase